MSLNVKGDWKNEGTSYYLLLLVYWFVSKEVVSSVILDFAEKTTLDACVSHRMRLIELAL